MVRYIEWKDLALIKECICPDGSDRYNHRQDHAVLSILFYKIYIMIYVDMSPHNNLINN
jgi:hypothetical protein